MARGSRTTRGQLLRGGLQTALAIVGTVPSGLPRAASLQSEVSPADQVLIRIAREGGRLVAWWWGVRKVDGQHAAVCYVCDSVIVTGALNKGVTDPQRRAIDAHRADHWPDIRREQGQ